MVTPEQIAELRVRISESDSTLFSDAQLTEIIEQAEGSLNASAAVAWEIKAGMFASLVDTSESGSSRSQSQLQRNALSMATAYSTRASAEKSEDPEETPRPRSRRAIRR